MTSIAVAGSLTGICLAIGWVWLGTKIAWLRSSLAYPLILIPTFLLYGIGISTEFAVPMGISAFFTYPALLIGRWLFSLARSKPDPTIDDAPDARA